jgi:hypothetical protein
MPKLLFPKGTIFPINNAQGTLAEDTEVEFDASPDILAFEFAQAGRTDLIALLSHEDGKKVVVYNSLGTRFESEIEVKGKAKAETKPKEAAKAKTENEGGAGEPTE